MSIFSHKTNGKIGAALDEILKHAENVQKRDEAELLFRLANEANDREALDEAAKKYGACEAICIFDNLAPVIAMMLVSGADREQVWESLKLSLEQIFDRAEIIANGKEG